MKRIITMITAAALGLMAWTSHAASAIAAYRIGDGDEDYCETWEDVVSQVESATDSGKSISITLWGDEDGAVEMENVFTLPANANVTLDLNGCCLSCNGPGNVPSATVSVSGGSTLTITDSSEDWSGRIAMYSGELVRVESSSTLIIKGGTFKDSVVSIAGGKCTIYGGKFAADSYSERAFGEYLDSSVSWPASATDGYYVIGTPGTTPATVVTVKINGGAEESFATWDAFMTKYEDLGDGETNVEIKVVQSCELDTQLLIWGVASATLDLNGKTLTIKEDKVYYDIQVYGKLTIKDSSTDKTGRVVCPAGSDVKIENARQDATIIIDGGTFDVPIDPYGNITINGGKFRAAENGMDTFALADYVNTTGGATKPETTTEIDNVAYWVVTPGSTPATTSVAIVTVGTKATNCATWADINTAISGMVSGDTATITLEQPVAASSTVAVVAGEVTLDLNGQTVSMAKSVEMLYAQKGSKLTVQDSDPEKKGRFAVASGVNYTTTILYVRGATLVVTGGIYDGILAEIKGSGGMVQTPSSATISGGSFIASKNTYDGDDKFSYEVQGYLASGGAATKENVGGTDYWVVTSPVATVTVTPVRGEATTTSCRTWKDIVDALAGSDLRYVSVKLLQSVTADYVVGSGLQRILSFTFDLNGQTVSMTAAGTSDGTTDFGAIVALYNCGTVTVTDTSTGKNGRFAVASGETYTGTIFDKDTGLAIEAGVFDASLGGSKSGKISGGKFLAEKNSDGDAFAFESKLATGMEAKKDGDYWIIVEKGPAPFTGTVTVDGTPKEVTTWAGVQEIVTNATLGAISITLGEDMKMSETLYITNPNVTLDLMGKTLTLEAGVDIWVQNDADNNHGSLTINDSSTEQTGLIQKEGTSSDQGIWSQPNTKIVINAGKFDVKVDSLELSDRQKNIKINGGSFSTEKFGDASFNLSSCVNANATCEKNKAGDYWVVTLPFATLTIDGETVECSSWSELESKIEGMTAGQAAVVKLNEAIELNDQFKVKENTSVTLDLNGQTLTTKKTSYESYILTAYGTLTITDSSEGKDGRIVASTEGTSKEGISVDDGTLVIDEGIIDAYIGYYNDYKITLNGGSYSKDIYSDTQLTNYASKGSSVTENATKDHWVLTSPVATVTINGADTPCMDWDAVNAAVAGASSAKITLRKDLNLTTPITLSGTDVTLDLNGKKITGAEFAESTSTNAVIYANATKTTITDSSTNKTGRVVSSPQDVLATYVGSGASLYIEAGIFDGRVDANPDSVDLSISGGSFLASQNSSDGKFALEGCVTDGKAAKEEDGYWVVAESTFSGTVTIDGAETNITSWAELVTVVSNKTSGTVEIKLDESNAVEAVSTLYIGGADVTLDLNGQTLTLGDEAIIDVAGGSLTINDSSTNKTGRVTNTTGGDEHGILADDEAKLVINDGTYDVLVYGDPAEINGGKFRAADNTADGDEDEADAYLLDGSVSSGHSSVKQTVDGVEYWVVVDFEIKKETATEAAAEYTYETTADGTVKITGFVNPTLDGTTLVLPDMIDGKFVTEIADKAFMNASLGITSVKLPICCTKIGKKAFCLIGSLTSVTFVDVRDWQDLTQSAELTIGNYAFDATGLTSVEIPSCVTKIGNYAFADCRKLASATVAGSPTYGYRPFRRAGVDVGKTVELTMAVTQLDVMSDTGKVQFTVAVDTTDTTFPWGAVDVNTLKVEYAETLDGAKTALTPTLVSQGSDGSATIEVTPPEGSSSGFFWTTIKTED